MKKILAGCSILLLTVLALTACKPAEAPEADVAQAAEPVFKRAWVRSLPPGMKMTAGFGVLTNGTDKAIELVSFASPSFQSVSLHLSQEIDGVSSMTGVDSLTLQPGETVEMMPGGYHLMMMGPRQSMSPGNQVLIQMTSAAGQTFEYEVSVENR